MANDWEDAPGQWEDAPERKVVAPKTEKKRSYFAGNLSPLGGLDAAASLLSGAVAGPVSGLAGLGQGAVNMFGGNGMSAGDRVEQVQNALTYRPQTGSGEGITNAITYPFTKLAELGDYAGGRATDASGSPVAGTVANTSLQAIPLMLGRVAPAKVSPKSAQMARNDAMTMQAKEAGYSLPPSQVNPSFFNQAVEAIGGKVKSAQALSIKDQAITNSLVKRGLGLNEEAPLTVETLRDVRKNAGQAYERVRGAGRVTTDPVYLQELDAIAAPFKKAAEDFPETARTEILDSVKNHQKASFDASSAVDKIRQLREKADKAYADKDKTLGKAYKDIAGAMEDQLGRHLEASGAPADVIAEFRQARQKIAQTYTVEKHLHHDGNVDAQGLARELKKGKPISGEMKTVAEFGQQFPRAAQMPSKVGGIPMTLFDLAAGPVTASLMMDPSYLALSAARPAVRSLIASKPYQNTFVNPQDTGPSMISRLRSTQRNPLIPLSEIAEGQRSY